MSNRTNNLHLFELDSMQDYIAMWSELDNDYSEEGASEGNTDDDLEELGFKSQSEKVIKQLFATDWDDCDESRVQHVMGLIEEGHGSHSSQFMSIVEETEDHVFNVAVSYLT